MPLYPRGEKNEQGKNEKGKQIADIPKGDHAEQVTGVENEPRAWVKLLDKGFFAFPVTPGD
jgi:hypothetical protein